MKVFFTVVGLAIFLAGSTQSNLTLYFDFNKHELTPASRTSLDSLLQTASPGKENFRFELHGHCDAIGSDGYNNILSDKRVSSVKNYLLGQGIMNRQFVTLKGHGKREPLNANSTDEERQLNRRVELSWVLQDVSKTSLKEKIADTAVVVGTSITLRNINFEGGRHIFLPASTPALYELLDAMKAYPSLVIRVEGHICCQATAADGMDLDTGLPNLSEARAKAVQDFLLENGIDPSRVSYKGFGHSMPLHPYPENSAEEMTENRRVEIKILKK